MITIVTAFFDIGRSNWNSFQRSTDIYFESFSILAKLENNMIIYTSKDLIDRISKIRGDKPTKIIAADLNDYSELREKISNIQQSEDYQKMVLSGFKNNPEYCNPDYVLVNYLKSSFVVDSIPLVETELLAWIDFGYCRNEEALNNVKEWCYDFDVSKIHVFHLMPIEAEKIDILYTVFNNVVYITGPCIVGSKRTWPIMKKLVDDSLNELMKHNIVDDDQTLYLMSYLKCPDLFELHNTNGEWFIHFRDYHTSVKI